MTFGMILLNQNIELCYMDTGSFIINIKTEDVYGDVADDIDKKIWYIKLWSYKATRKKENVIGMMKDKLGGKIITEFAAVRPKIYSYLMDDGNSDKKTKGKIEICNKKNP